MTREMIVLPKEKYDRLLEEHRKIGENIIKSETPDGYFLLTFVALSTIIYRWVFSAA
jgi:hypothetical protein